MLCDRRTNSLDRLFPSPCTVVLVSREGSSFICVSSLASRCHRVLPWKGTCARAPSTSGCASTLAVALQTPCDPGGDDSASFTFPFFLRLSWICSPVDASSPHLGVTRGGLPSFHSQPISQVLWSLHVLCLLLLLHSQCPCLQCHVPGQCLAHCLWPVCQTVLELRQWICQHAKWFLRLFLERPQEPLALHLSWV